MDILLFLISPAQLTLYLNIALGVILLCIIIYGISSMLKRALPQAFSICSFIVLMVVGILLAHPLSQWFSNVDISWISSSFSLNGQEVSVTTVQETIKNILTALAGNDEKDLVFIALTNKDLAQYIEALSTLLVSYITFFLYVLLVFIIGKPICAFIYHCGFKFIFPKKVRKYRYKRKWKSVLIGMTNATLSCAMLLTPLFAIVNTVNYGLQKNKSTEIIDQESYDNIMQWSDAYNDSLFAKILFGIKDDSGRSLDMMLMDYVTKTDYDGSTLLFSDQISSISDAAEKIIASGILGDDENGINYASLLSKSFITSMITTVTDSQFFMKLFPILINIALTYVDNNELFDTSYIDLDNLDWKEELKNVNQIYNSLYDAGIISDLIDGDDFKIPFSDTAKDSLHQAFSLMDESTMLHRIIPAVIYTYVIQEDEDNTPSALSFYLSTDWDDYQDIKWGRELLIIYDTLYQLSKVGIEIVINNTSSDNPSPKEAFVFKNAFLPNFITKNVREDEEAPANNILQILLDHFDDVAPILTGYKSDGELDVNHEYLTIFDSQLIMKNIDKALNYAADTMLLPNEETGEKPLINGDDLKNALKHINGSQEYKYEVFNLLKAAKILLGNDDFDLNNAGALLENLAFREALCELSAIIDNSIVLSNVMPYVLENALANISFGDNIPLSGQDLNFRNIKFAVEIPLLLDGYESALSLSESFDGGDVNSIISTIDTENLKKALTVMYQSQIINPRALNNANFYAILDLIFDNEDFKEIGMYQNKEVDYSKVQNWEQEIQGIANIFTSLKADSILDLFNAETISLLSINPTSIQDLFASIDDSILIRNTFGAVLDHLLGEVIDVSLDGVSFENVTNWTEEGNALSRVIAGFKTIGQEIENVDWLNTDPSISEEILTNFASMQVFESPKAFGAFIWKNIHNSGDEINSYLKDYPEVGSPTYLSAQSDFESVEDWANEISLMTSFIKALQDMDGEVIWTDGRPNVENPGTQGLNYFINGNATSAQLRSVLIPLSEIKMFRMISINAINEVINSITDQVELIDLSMANIDIIAEDDLARKNDLLLIPDIYELVQSFTEENIYDEDRTEELLISLHNSYIFNTLKNPNNIDAQGRRDLTVFEQTIVQVAVKTGIAEYVANSLDNDVQTNKIQNNVLSIHNSMNNRDDISNDEWLDQSDSLGEITKLKNILIAYNNSNLGTFDSNIIFDADLLSVQEVLEAVNHSRVTHDATPVFLNHLLTISSIDSLVDDQTKIDYQLNHLGPLSINERMALYDQEIVYITNAIDLVRIRNSDDSKEIFNFRIGNFVDLITPVDQGGKGKSTISFFTLLKHSRILEETRSEIIVNIIDKINNSQFIRPYDGTKEEKIAKIESYFSSDLEPNYQLDPTIEGKSIDLIVPMLNQESIMSQSNFEDLLDQGDTISKIITNTMIEGKRAYLSSEIVAGFLNAYGPQEHNAIAWVTTSEGALDDFALLNSTSAQQLDALFVARLAFDQLAQKGAEITEDCQEAITFQERMAYLDTFRENEEAYNAVLAKLANAMFYETVCETTQCYYDGNIISLNEYFVIRGANTFTDQSQCVIEALMMING